MNFPTFLEIKDFILNHQRATICEIRDHFNQKGDDVIFSANPDCKKKVFVLAYGINGDFFDHLRDFMKQDYVILGTHIWACRISDNTNVYR